MSTLTVHDAFAARVPPTKLIEPAPATGLNVPPQVLLPFGAGATTNPAGRLSVNASPVSVTFVFGFWMVKVSVVVPFNGIWCKVNNFWIVGGTATVRLAVAVLPVPPLVEVTEPVVLVY